MWLSEKTAGPLGRGATAARLGRVTIGGPRAGVLLDGEARALELLAPGGVSWQAKEGQEVLVLETEDGERFVLGVVSAGQDAAPAALCLDGEVRITGRLFLNGQEITVGEGGTWS